jgi:hypothetical protein
MKRRRKLVFVKDGPDPTGCPFERQGAKRRCHVDERMTALGPDVERRRAAGKLPTLRHQDGFITQWVESRR